MIRVLIADHPIVRKGLRNIRLAKSRAAVRRGQRRQPGLMQVQREKWDLVILDITVPGRSGLDALGEL
jgi:DNA-binding NarL/FixJ family response regulator